MNPLILFGILFIFIIFIFISTNKKFKEVNDKIDNLLKNIEIPPGTSPGTSPGRSPSIADIKTQILNSNEFKNKLSEFSSSTSSSNSSVNQTIQGTTPSFTAQELGFEVSSDGSNIIFNKNIIFNENVDVNKDLNVIKNLNVTGNGVSGGISCKGIIKTKKKIEIYNNSLLTGKKISLGFITATSCGINSDHTLILGCKTISNILIADQGVLGGKIFFKTNNSVNSHIFSPDETQINNILMGPLSGNSNFHITHKYHSASKSNRYAIKVSSAGSIWLNTPTNGLVSIMANNNNNGGRLKTAIFVPANMIPHDQRTVNDLKYDDEAVGGWHSNKFDRFVCEVGLKDHELALCTTEWNSKAVNKKDVRQDVQFVYITNHDNEHKYLTTFGRHAGHDWGYHLRNKKDDGYHHLRNGDVVDHNTCKVTHNNVSDRSARKLARNDFANSLNLSHSY